MADTALLTRFGHIVRENLHGDIIGLCLTERYQYEDAESYEHHYTILVVQPNRTYDSRDHYVVHKIGIHSNGTAGIVGSGGYYMEDEQRAREDFVSRCQKAMLARVP
jgi:hypothetical protein